MSSVRPPERRQLTVMLCDLVGWTALSLRLDAEELAEVVQAYRQRCTSLITRHGGVVAQYVGDGILAYFGYPRAHEDDAERAIRAAIAITVAERTASATGGSSVHIGIATGVVVVGNLHGEAAQRRDDGADPQGRAAISAVGSALNLAARLQALAAPGMVVVSEQTRRLSRGVFEYKDLGRHDLRGFDQPIQAWQALGEITASSRFNALRASALTPLVDRRPELQELRKRWEAVQAAEGSALLLTSEPGVGKSRLADEVARRIVSRRCLRLWFHCSAHLQSSPLAPLIRQLTLAAGFADGDDDASKLAKLAALVPKGANDPSEIVALLANLLSIKYEHVYPPLNMSPQRRKQQLFQVILHLLACLASRRPVLLIVEDLHWADPSSDELIGMIIDRVKGLPVFAVLTARPEFNPHWSDQAHLLQMRLSPLDRSDSVAMIQLLCDGKDVPAHTVAAIAERTDGLPLFIEDLTKDVLELADLQATRADGTIRDTRSPFAIRTTLADALMSRLDRLGSAKAVAQHAAAIGREFSYELLSTVADLPEETLREELHRLVNAGLLISRPSTAVLTYAFKHALVRDAAYSSLLKKSRTALHARIARALVDDFPETKESQPEVLAHHFQAAEDVGEAVRYLVQGAKLSAMRSGFVEAIDQLQSALRLLNTQPPAEARMRRELRVHLTLGGVYAEYLGFSSSECGDAYATALELCHRLGDAPEIFSVLSGIGAFEITRANFEKCRTLAEQTLARAAKQHAKPPFIMGHLLFGGTLFLTGEFTSARQHLNEALALYEQERTSRGKQALYVQDQKSTGLCYLALTLTIMGDLDSGMRAGEAGLSHSRSLGGPHTINFSLCYLGAMCHFRRDPQGALRYATESLTLAREQGFATWIGVSQIVRGEALASTGNCEEGLKEIAAGVAAHRAIKAVTYEPFGLSLFVKGLLADGKLDEALETLAEALALSERTGERFWLAELWRLKGEILARKGSTAEAEHWLHESIELAKQQGARLFELRSAVSLCRLLDKGRRATALSDVLEPVYKWFEEGLDAPDLRDARALLSGDAQ